MAGKRSTSLARIRDGHALLTKIERLHLLELEREAADLAELEIALAQSLANGVVNPTLAKAYAERLKSVRGKAVLVGLRIEAQAGKTLSQAAREKVAERLLGKVATEEKRVAERTELAQIIENALTKTSLP